ncbi:MAG: FAD-dependent oxidoreductase [Planctomycetes bacterium]|nr:FAD-dependent oxidoreductase [Planctomycetota bacterium]
MTPGRVIVVGGGVVGASAAYYLSQRGWEVDLIDQGKVGEACSAGNCGYICPSHVFPLCRPGAIAKTLPLILRRNSPFAVRPRLDLHLISFFARFAMNCRDDLMQETSVALHDLLQHAKDCYEQIIREERIDCDLETRGCLFIYRDAHHLDAFASENEYIRRRFGFCAKRLDGRELARLEPTLRDDLAGAWLFESDWHIRPDRFMAGLKSVLARRGVKVHEDCPAIGLNAQNGRALAVQTPQGMLAADAFVFATGAWTPRLKAMLGCRLPIEPGKGYSMTADFTPGQPTYPMIFEEHRVAITPWKSGLRIGSTMEFAGYDESIRPERLRLLTDAAPHYLREWQLPQFKEQWFGWRPMTPDGRPYIDFSPKLSNVMIAAGHNMIGMSTGPGTGRLVAEMLSGESPGFDPRPFRIGR